MKCRVESCDALAVHNMRQHKLALCEEHYPQWVEGRVRDHIDKYRMFPPGTRVLVAVSGGKDSMSVWHILNRLGYDAHGFHIDMGIREQSARSREAAEAHARRHDLPLHVMDLRAEMGAAIREAAVALKRKGNTCAVCGMTRRYLMNRFALENGYDAIVTGHNLDDEVATLFGNVLRWDVGYFARQYPVLEEAEGLIRKAKPLSRFYEREVLAYAILTGIPYWAAECPYSQGATSRRYKYLFTELEMTSPGAKQHFYIKFLKKQEAGAFEQYSLAPQLEPCAQCGQPTSNPDRVCSFCRTWDRVRERLAHTSQKEKP